MAAYEVLDTFPAFDRVWRKVRTLPPEQQLASWRRDYLRPWPELFRKQAADYRDQGVAWRDVALHRIFPHLDARLARMRKVRASILRAIPGAVSRCRAKLGLDFPVTFVIHVGIGGGAGWSTTFGGRPAVLFGLENAAELGWTDSVTAAALVAHEIAHLLHERWRRRSGLPGADGRPGPWWRLYEEGFATYCELDLGPIGNHHSTERGQNWLGWCRANRRRLATLFLRTVTSRRPTHRFFGSWNHVDDYIDTGYYLGSEVIRDGASRYSLREIACWSSGTVRLRARNTLRRMSAGS